uniref:Genome polyprotein n=1 Tax=Ascaris suum TaxID=6253 RepID=F1KPM0_ASCSU
MPTFRNIDRKKLEERPRVESDTAALPNVTVSPIVTQGEDVPAVPPCATYKTLPAGLFWKWISAFTLIDPQTTDAQYLRGFLEGTVSVRLEDVLAMRNMPDNNSVWSYIMARTYMPSLFLVKNRRLKMFLNYIGFLIPGLDLVVFERIFGKVDDLLMDDWMFVSHIGVKQCCPACRRGESGHYEYIAKVISDASLYVNYPVQQDEYWDPYEFGLQNSEDPDFGPGTTFEDGIVYIDQTFDQRTDALVMKRVITDLGYDILFRYTEQPEDVVSAPPQKDPLDKYPCAIGPPRGAQVWEENGSMTEDVLFDKHHNPSVEARYKLILDSGFTPGQETTTPDIRFVNPKTGRIWTLDEIEADELKKYEEGVEESHETIVDTVYVDYKQYYEKHKIRPPQEPTYSRVGQDYDAETAKAIQKENHRLYERWCRALRDHALGVKVPDYEVLENGMKVVYVKPNNIRFEKPPYREDVRRIPLQPVTWEEALDLFHQGLYDPDKYTILQDNIVRDKTERVLEGTVDEIVPMSGEAPEYEEIVPPENIRVIEEWNQYVEARRAEELETEAAKVEWDGPPKNSLDEFVVEKPKRKKKNRKPRHDYQTLPDTDKMKASADVNKRDPWYDSDDDIPGLVCLSDDVEELDTISLDGERHEVNEGTITDAQKTETQTTTEPLTNDAVVVLKDHTMFERVLLDAVEEDITELGEEPVISWREYLAEMKSPANLASEAVAVPGMRGKLLPNPLVVIRTNENYYPVTKISMVPEVTLVARKILSWAHGVVMDSNNLDVELSQGNSIWQNEWAKRFLHCPRFSFIAQYQNRCPFIHWHEESCLRDHQMTDIKCELHGWAHARDWLDYTLQIIALYHNMDPTVPRYYLLSTLGLPLVIKLMYDSPPSLARRSDWVRGYLAGGFARIGPYMGQGPGAGSSLMSAMSSFRATVVKGAKDLATAVKAATNYILDFIVRLIKPVETVKKYIVDLVSGVIDSVFVEVFSFLYDAVEWTERHSHLVMTTIEVLVLLVMVALGLMEWKTAEIIVGATTVSGLWCSVFRGQAPDNPLLSAMTLITGIYYFLRPMQVAEIRDRLTQLSLVLTTAGIAAGTINLIYFLIPEGMRLALKYTFGGSAAVVTERISSWRSRVIALNKLSSTNDVLISREYYDLVKKSINEGLGFLRDAPPSERNNVMTMMPPLMRLDHILWSYQEARRDRPLPFVLHLSGRPGVGKTLLVHSILTKLGYGPSDVYFRPVSSEFWDGYSGQKVIVYDEFLVGSEMAERVGTEFLQLASTAHFQVPSASVENPLVGIKGTYSHPEVVITICNHIYPVVMSIPEDALHRRRSVVVNFDFSKYAKKKGGNTVDLGAYSPEDYSKAPWVECRLYPPQPDGTSGRIASGKGVCFEDFLEILTHEYDQHAQVVKKLLSAHIITPDTLSPSEVLSRALAQMEGVPPGPVNIFTYITNCVGRVGSFFTGQGPKVECKNGICMLSDTAFEYDAVETYLGPWIQPTMPVTYHEMLTSGIQRASGWALIGKTMTMTAAMIGIVLLARAITRRFSDASDTVTFISEGSGEPRRKKRRAKEKRYHWGSIDAQSEGPFAQAEIVFPHESGGSRITVLPLKERFICTYYHALLGVIRNKPTICVQLLYNGKRYTANIVWANVVVDHENDLVVMELENPQIPQFPSIMNKLISEDDFELITEFPVMLSLVRSGAVVPIMTTAVKAENRSYVVDESMVTLDLALIYQADTQPGDCGSALMVRSGPYVGKIVGIHVAGKADDMGPSHGMAVVITRESMQSALERKAVVVPEDSGFVSQSVEVEKLDSGQEVFLPRHSRLKPSCLASHLGYETKQPAILSVEDERNTHSKDPVDVFIERLSPPLPAADPDILEEVKESMIHYYGRVEGVHPWRLLSLEEAIMGLPGWLPALNLDSSVGVPLCYRYKHGKREIMNITAQELRMDPGFGDAVASFTKSLIAGKEKAHWLGFLKDELVSENKINTVRTRVIYCGDVVAMVAFRMLIGSVVANFHSACRIVPHCIGLNPYSYDMHIIQQYLSEVGTRYVAGDYKDYDNRQHPQFREVAFQVLKSLALRIDGFSGKCWDVIAQYHRAGFVQIGDRLIKQASGHFSGSFLTTIVNCLVNEAYMRYVFMKKCPGRNFDDNVRMKCLGDDHVLCIRDGVNFGFSTIQQGLSEIGQIYTSDEKKSTCDEYRSFNEITFLGARPVVYKGRWVGSLKPDILRRMCMWTRDNDKSTFLVATIALDLATLVPGDFYEQFKEEVMKALEKAGMPKPELRPRNVVATEVANRTTQSGLCFFGHGPIDLIRAVRSYEWPMSMVLGEYEENLEVSQRFPRICHRCELCRLPFAQKPRKKHRGDHTFGTAATCFAAREAEVATGFMPQGPGPVMPHGSGRSTTLTKLDPPSDVSVLTAPTDSSYKSGATDQLSLEQCAASYIQKVSFEWKTGHASGDVIYTCSVPFGLLAQGTQDSVQNMPFERFTYWKGDVEIMIQINGNPFQQGLLYVYFYPLSHSGQRLPRISWPSVLHVTLQPGAMNSAVLRVPYRFPSPVMIIQKSTSNPVQTYDLGTVCVGVMSRLKSVETESVTVTMYVRFPNSEFHGPRVRSPAQVFTAQGASSSTLTNNYIYDIKDVAGAVGISSSNADTGQQVSGSLGLEMPLDNPPLASGSVPMMPVFSGMSRSMGLEPTVPLSLNPIEADRYHKGLFEPVEQTMTFLLSRPFLHKSVEWGLSENAGTILWSIDFDSMLSYAFDGKTQIGVPLAALNMFHYWRADLHIKFHVIKTSYHTGRLRLTAAYDMMQPDLASSTSYYNKVFDFTELDEGEFIVPYMASTEFRRTMDGAKDRLPNYKETYGVASVSLLVVNPLRLLSTTVSNTVDVLIYCWFENAVVAVPRSICPFRGMYHGTVISATQREGVDQKFVAQGPFPEVEEKPTQPDRLSVGKKFEYRVANVLDVARRMVPIDMQNVLDGAAYSTITSEVAGVPPNACTIRVFPASMVGMFYAAWAGTLRYRVFVPKADDLYYQITYVPLPLWSSGNRPWTTGDLAALAFTPSTTVSSTTAALTTARIAGAYGAITGPNEIMASMSTFKDWIDVSIPFRSNFSFLVMPLTNSTGTLSESFTGTYPGSMCFAFTKKNFRLFQAVGDDFDFGIFRPPLDLQFIGMTNLPKPSPSTAIGGFVL